LETWKSTTNNDKSLSVRFLYNGQTIHLPFCPLNADGLCPLTILINYLTNYIPLDYIHECNAQKPRKRQEHGVK